MAVSRLAAARGGRAAMRAFLMTTAIVIAAGLTAAVQAQAQQPQATAEARVIVTGEGAVSVAPDYAEIRSGVITRAQTAKEATDANSKLMTAVTTALLGAGIEQKDIQTSRFSVQPLYTSPQPGAAQRLTGFSVSNQVEVTVRQIAKVSDILDRLIASGASDVGSVEFLHSDPSKVLDQARQAAVADARRKADLYARAAGLNLGPVVWITEDSGYAPPMPMGGMRALAAAPAVPISIGEGTLRAQITVGFDLAR